jgi:hypothetical protein
MTSMLAPTHAAIRVAEVPASSAKSGSTARTVFATSRPAPGWRSPEIPEARAAPASKRQKERHAHSHPRRNISVHARRAGPRAAPCASAGVLRVPEHRRRLARRRDPPLHLGARAHLGDDERAAPPRHCPAPQAPELRDHLGETGPSWDPTERSPSRPGAPFTRTARPSSGSTRRSRKRFIPTTCRAGRPSPRCWIHPPRRARARSGQAHPLRRHEAHRRDRPGGRDGRPLKGETRRRSPGALAKPRSSRR